MKTVKQVVKQVGASGQISLGKEFAGRTVVVDNSEPGVWVIKTAQTIPDSELWLHQPEAVARLDRAMDAMHQPPRSTDLEELEQHLGML
jgi:hypothetical protein